MEEKQKNVIDINNILYVNNKEFDLDINNFIATKWDTDNAQKLPKINLISSNIESYIADWFYQQIQENPDILKDVSIISSSVYNKLIAEFTDQYFTKDAVTNLIQGISGIHDVEIAQIRSDIQTVSSTLSSAIQTLRNDFNDGPDYSRAVALPLTQTKTDKIIYNIKTNRIYSINWFGQLCTE